MSMPFKARIEGRRSSMVRRKAAESGLRRVACSAGKVEEEGRSTLDVFQGVVPLTEPMTC
jgi:hypothetical protein